MLKKYTVKAIFESEWNYEGKTGKTGKLQVIDLDYDYSKFTCVGKPVKEYKFNIDSTKSIFGSLSYQSLVDKDVYLSFDRYGRVNGCELVK